MKKNTKKNVMEGYKMRAQLSRSSSISNGNSVIDPRHLAQTTSLLIHFIPIGSIKKMIFFHCHGDRGTFTNKNYKVIGIDPHSNCAFSVKDEEILPYKKANDEGKHLECQSWRCHYCCEAQFSLVNKR